MAASANTLITRALQLIGVCAAGEIPTPDDLNDGLATLNDMVDAWATERLTIYTEARQTKVLTPLQQTYTIGSGANINVARPLWIHNAGIIPIGQTNEIRIDVIADDEWAKVAIKSLQSTFPTTMYYDYNFNSSGYGNINVWPIPTTAPTLVLYLPQAISTFADGTTSYSFPPGYERMIRFNLALELAPEYGKPIDPAVAAIAMQSKANVKRANIRIETLDTDAALLPTPGKSTVYNWRVDR